MTDKRHGLYLAYGSNLNVGEMAHRCPGARPRGWIMVNDARLVFRGCADIEYAPGWQVPCGLWSITAEDEAMLDRYEGVRSNYYQRWTLDIGRGQRALVYMMVDREGVCPPSSRYVETIREGYGDFGFDEAFLDRAVAESFKRKNDTEHTLERRRRPSYRAVR